MAAKPISKKIEKRVKKGRKAAKKQAEAVGKKAKAVKKTLTPGSKPSRAKVAGVAVAGVAGIAGLAATLRYLRRDSRGRATLHVVAHESEWHITSDGRDEPLHRFPTKEEAVDAARAAAQEAAPSELVIHRLDGSVMRSHSYDPK